MRRHREGHEGGAGNDRALADDRLAAEHAGVGVDGDVVLNSGMALHASQTLTTAGGKRAQRDALVQLHMVTDGSGLADDDASAVIDEEVLADMSSRAPMSMPVEKWAFRSHAR